MNIDVGDSKEESFKNTPSDWAARWTVEFAAFKRFSEGFYKDGEEAERRLLDERDSIKRKDYRLNLFAANVDTLRALLFGNVPRTDVTRKFQDMNDDQARIAGEALERNLNEDEQGSSTLAAEAEAALDDRLVPGLGVIRCRYVMEEEEVEGTDAILDEETGEEKAPAVPATTQKASEDVELDYVHWKDFRWSPARTWKEVRWVAFRAEMPLRSMEKRFGDVAKLVPLNSKRGSSGATEGGSKDAQKFNPWPRADVWEIWDKDSKKVFWMVEGFSKTLDIKPDPLGLKNFFPCGKPWMANTTNSKFIPRPDYFVAKDQYEKIDNLENRIASLIDCVKVVGGYDAAVPELALMLKKKDGELVKVSNWAMFGEKGGIRGSVDFFPLDMVVAAIDKLTQKQSEEIAKLNQLTGMSDIVRGQAQEAATATEQSIKAKFASVRLKRMQDGFAALVTSAQAIKAEIICKHFDVETIIKRSNMESSPEASMPAPPGPDGQPAIGPDGRPLSMLHAAAQLLKDKDLCYRIEVKPESVTLTDYASVKQERTELMAAFGQFLQGMALPGAMQLMPIYQPLFQWLVAGLKGAASIEGVIDAGFAQMQAQKQQAAQQPPPPDPKLQAQQMKTQGDMQLTQMQLQADLQKNQAEVQGDVQRQAAQAHYNILENTAKERAKSMASLDSVLGTGGAA